ncbi:MAG: hypothetical protein HDR80_05550 [Bacteroides sp.]|nr:hypothetical protein [Bacteroides sp.]
MKLKGLLKSVLPVAACAAMAVPGAQAASWYAPQGKSADGGVTIYGTVLSSTDNATSVGVYSFTPDADLTLEPVHLDPNLSGVNGTVRAGDKYYNLNMMTLNIWDTNSWELIDTQRLMFPAFMEFGAKSQTYDPTTETVYGCYLTLSQSYRIAAADFTDMSQVEVKDLGGDVWMDVMMVTPAGSLYGVRNDGMLCTIDKASGAITEVGSTGIVPSGNQGAVCDPTGDKAYWTASTENGSGLYEIDLSDGSTTLIADFPNAEQITGLYIEGDIVTPEPPVVSGDMTIYGNVLSSTDGATPVGIYSFTPAPDLSLAAVHVDSDLSGVNGTVCAGDRYYQLQMMTLRTYDTNSWEMISEKRLGFPAFMNFSAKSLAYDTTTGTVYGCFLTTMQSYRLATADYEAETQEEIVDLGGDVWMDVMMFTPDGKLYGVRNDGMLCAIDKTSGVITEVGSTGIVPSGNQGAVCDPSGEKAYWTASSENGSGLYEIDLSDGSTTLVADFPNGEQLTGLFVKVEQTEAQEVPGIPEDLAFDFASGALTGTVSFKVPEESASGNPLKGVVNYTLTANEEVLAEGTAAPGDQVSEEVSVPVSGDYLGSVVLATEAGEGKPAYRRVYLGYDTPMAPADVTLSIADLMAAVTWTAPSKGVAGEYFDASLLTYDVVRYPDAVTVAKGISATTYTDRLPGDELTSYSYGVIAHMADMQSAEAMSNFVTAGSVVSVPYTEDFDDDNALALYTVIDANGDGSTWGIDTWSPILQYNSGRTDHEADDWAITPPIHMDGNEVYMLTFTAIGNNENYTQNIGAMLGKDNTVAAMTVEVVPLTDICDETRQLRAVFTVEKTGTYYIGLYTHTGAQSGWLDVTGLSVEKVADKKGPAPVTDFNVTPGAKGALSAKVAFKTPTETSDGEKLTSLAKAELKRDGVVVKTWEAPAPGATLDFEDTGLDAGMHSYQVQAFSDKGAGYPVLTELFIGKDIPSAVEDLQLALEGRTVVLTWTPSAVGIHGGYVDVDNLKYSIQRNDGEYMAIMVDGCTYTDTPPMEAHPYDLAYAVVAISDEGISPLAISPLLLFGPDYKLPFSESFPGATTTNYWGLQNGQTGSFSLYDGWSSDNDGGCVLYRGEPGESKAEIYTGWIDMTGDEWPEMKLVAGLNSGSAKWGLEYIDEAGERHDLGTLALNKAGSIYNIEVSLTECAGQRVQICITCEAQMANTMVLLDQIEIWNDKDQGVEGISASEGVAVAAIDGGLRVSAPDGSTAFIYTLDGTLAAERPAPCEISLAPAIYIVKVAGRTFKTVVR